MHSTPLRKKWGFRLVNRKLKNTMPGMLFASTRTLAQIRGQTIPHIKHVIGLYVPINGRHVIIDR